MAIPILSLLPQAQQDPASGAAKSQLTWCRLLAGLREPDGSPAFTVRALGTTASEFGSGLPGGAVEFLRSAGLAPVVSSERLAGRIWSVLRFQDRGIDCTLLDTGGQPLQLTREAENALDALLQHHLATGAPKVALVFGGSPADFTRRHLLREHGARVLFGLHNHGYYDVAPAFFSPLGGIDAVFCPSRYLRDRYAAHLGVQSEVFLPPLDPVDLPAVPAEERVFLTFINPSAAKGLYFFVRFADELARRRPDLPMLVVESRGGGRELLSAAHAAGLDLKRHESLMIAPGVMRASEIYAVTRLTLMPSVWAEPAGRVVLESMHYGIPPILSDRGGLPEVAGPGGIVLPLPETLQPETRTSVDVAAVEPWIEAVERLSDDESAYAEASTRARQAARRALPAAQLGRFETLVRGLVEQRP